MMLKAQSHPPLVKLKTQTLSTGEAAPTGSVPHSEPIVSTVRHVTGNDQDYLRKNPQSGCTEICASLKGPL